MYSAIIVAAGRGERSGLPLNKVLIDINGKPLIQCVLEFFNTRNKCREVILVVNPDDEALMRKQFSLSTTHIVVGGEKRQDSVKNGVALAKEDKILIHDGARPVLSDALLDRFEKALEKSDAISLSVPVVDTLKHVKNGMITADVARDTMHHIQTPQGFTRTVWLEAYNKALQQDQHFTCDASLVKAMIGCHVYTVLGERRNVKLTTPGDVALIQSLLSKEGETVMRIGHSKDIHRLQAGRGLNLGGLTIDSDVQSIGHSDGDCLLHTIAEALFGALGEGDLGTHFPDTDAQHKGLDSTHIVARAKALLQAHGFAIENIDSTVFLEKPKLAPIIAAMRKHVASLLGIETTRVNIKAATWEGLDSIGQRESIMCETVVLIAKKGRNDNE